jgi:iron complex transport system permease protein
VDIAGTTAPARSARPSLDFIALSLLWLALLLAVLAACLLGSTPLGFDRLLDALLGAGLQGDRIVVWQIRLPRALCAALVGAALGASGAALQGLLRNPLAEPGVLGVTATAALGALGALYLGAAAFTPWSVPLAAIAGALLATLLIAVAALRTRSVVTLILVGVGLSGFAGALTSLLINLVHSPFTLSDMVNWMLGTVANRSFADLGFAAPFVLAGLGLLALSRRGLSALVLGEEAAQGVGLDLARQRLLVVLGAGLATGGAVAVAGSIGFVGIIAPHLVRPWVAHDPARTLLPAALLGALLLVVADITVRLLPTGTELRLGVVAALLGAPLFVWIALRGRR